MELSKEALDFAVRLHNEYRGQHGAQLVTLNEKLCEEAMTYAKMVAQGSLTRKDIPGVGQNIHHIEGNASDLTAMEAIRDAVTSWYRKIDVYNWEDPFSSGQGAHLFTQLIWRWCSSIGVGVATCKMEGRTVVVVLYSPSGNIPSEKSYKLNVLSIKP